MIPHTILWKESLPYRYGPTLSKQDHSHLCKFSATSDASFKLKILSTRPKHLNDDKAIPLSKSMASDWAIGLSWWEQYVVQLRNRIVKFQGPVGLGHNVRDSFPRFPPLTPSGYDAPEGGTANHLLNDTIEWNNS